MIELLAGPSNDNAVTVTTTATADSGGATAAQTSEADVGYLASYADPLNALAASVFPPCASVFLHGSGLRRAIRRATPSPGGRPRRRREERPPLADDLLGTADDSLFLPADSSEGGWSVELVDAVGARDQLLPFTVELDGAVESLAADRATYRAGDVVQVSGAFRNLGRASLEAGTPLHAGGRRGLGADGDGHRGRHAHRRLQLHPAGRDAARPEDPDGGLDADVRARGGHADRHGRVSRRRHDHG